MIQKDESASLERWQLELHFRAGKFWSEALMIIVIHEYSAIFMNTYTFSWNLRILWLYRQFHEIFSKKSKGINNSIYH